jgi:hypothetical protein
MMLTVVKPSPLRLWGFVLTVLGGALLAFGSIADWAAVSLGGSTEAAVPTKGIDLWQGTATLALGVLIVVGVLALRFVRPHRRAPVAIALIVLGTVALGLAVWCAASLSAVVTDTGVDTLVDTVVAQLGIPAAQARDLVEGVMAGAGVEVQARAGLWLTLTGAVLATAGGAVDLAWVRRKRTLGDAIDADTSTAGDASDPAGGREPDPPGSPGGTGT